MLKNTSLAVLALASALAGSAFAADFAYPVANETGSGYHNPEYAFRSGKLVRIDEPGAPSANAQRADENWRLAAGDTGWQLEQHAYALSNGRLKHADTFRHDTPRPAYDPSNDPFASSLYTGG